MQKTNSGKSTAISEKKTASGMQNDNSEQFLTIESALSNDRNKSRIVYQRSNSTILNTKSAAAASLLLSDSLIIETKTDGCVHISRTQNGRDIHPDRISLDRRGLHSFPIIDGETRLRLLSLQHNLINNLDGLKTQTFPYLVFLDIYDNQLEQLNFLNTLDNLRVLLIGKNRIKKIDGLSNLKKIEVLDLHGNQITQVHGLGCLGNLKVLNLAGNQIRFIGSTDFQGLVALEELNLRRNRLRKLMGLGDTPNLTKLFISNNEIQNVDDISILAKSINLKEISIDNNPIYLNGDCVSFLVSYLPNLLKLNSAVVTEQVRKAAMAWRRNKETTNTAFMDLTSDVCLNIRREEIISNARTNWELLRSQTKLSSIQIKSTSSPLQNFKNLTPDCDLILTKFGQTTNSKKFNKLTKNTTNSNNSIIKVPLLCNRNKILNRTSSQDTDTTSSSNNSNTSNEFVRLPPILIPLIKKMEEPSDNNDDSDGLKLSESISSIGANIDSSIGSIGSDHESEPESSSNHEQQSSKDNIVDSTQLSDENIKSYKNEMPKNNVKNVTIMPSSLSETNSSSGSNSTIRQQICSKKRNIKSALNNGRNAPVKWQTRASTAKQKKSPNEQPQPTRNNLREQGGDYLIEICGRYLNVFGQCALRFVDKPWNQTKANDVNIIKFTYCNFVGIVPLLCKLKIRFPNVETLIFKDTNIYCLGQLNALAEVQGFSSLLIESDGNLITKKKWRSYAIYRLSHWGLKIINDKQITEAEIDEANKEYQSLTDLVLWSIPDDLLQPLLIRLHLDVRGDSAEINSKKWLLSADSELKNVVCKEALQWKKNSGNQDDQLLRQKGKQYLMNILDDMAHTVMKLRALDREWPAILQEFVRNTLLDYSQMDVYMKRQMLELLKTL